MPEPTRIIKNGEQAGATTASFTDEFTPSAAGRIPAEKTSAPEMDAGGTTPRRGRVLRNTETRTAPQAVTIDADEFTADVPLPDDHRAPEPADAAGEDASAGEDAAAPESPVRTDAEWQERLDKAVAAARQEGYEEGREDGYDAGYREAETTVRAECDEARAALLEDTATLDARWADYVDQKEAELVELALALAEAIVDAPLTESLREVSEEALLDAVGTLAGAPPVTIRLHPDDRERLEASGLAARLEDTHPGLRWEADADCAMGDWSVRSPAGAVRRLRREVVQTLRDRLGLAAPSSADPS